MTTETPADERRYRARLAGLARHGAEEKELATARGEFALAQQTNAAHVVLDAVADRNANRVDAEVQRLRGPRGAVALRLLEAVELLAYLVRLSERPDEMLAALRERVDSAASTK